jgi:fatty acid-binding protein DegV
VNSAGKIEKAGVMLGRSRRSKEGEREFLSGERALLSAVGESLGASRGGYDFAVGHVANTAGAERLAAALREAYAPERPILVTSVSPALAVHVGPLGLGIAWMEA